MPARPIPVIALVGFLGAGKTTLLNHMLEHSDGASIGVVVNDYGDINIDAQLVQEQTDSTLELTNGCICCSMDSMELDEAIGQFAYPGSEIDYIVIEASGLAEPADLATTLRAAMTPATVLDSIVAVIDAAAWGQGEPGLVEQHIDHSDLIILNKVDLVNDSRRQEIHDAISQHNSRVRILDATNAAVNVGLMLEPKNTVSLQGHSHHDHHHHDHVHEHYATVSFTANRPLDPAAFQNFINHLPTSVYRAKGFVDFGAKGHHRKYILQVVGKRAQLTWDTWDDQTPATQLVFIGRDLDTDDLQQDAAACIDPHPDHIDPKTHIALPRHH